MCLILFAHHVHPHYPLILASNRDETLGRPTKPAHWWTEAPQVIAGRDELQQGTWIGATKTGKWGALTNFRKGYIQHALPHPSRGLLVADFLRGALNPASFIDTLNPPVAEYEPFNLLLAEGNQIFSVSSQNRQIITVPNGIHGLSNHVLNTPWPKTERGKWLLAKAIENPCFAPQDLFALLADEQHPTDQELPDTGIGIEWERFLSPIFVWGNGYRTRSSTIITISNKGALFFCERTYGETKNNVTDRIFEIGVYS